MNQFQVGKFYSTRSACDADCKIGMEIVKRTAKTVTVASGKSFRIFVYDGIECFRPWGNYSMAPIVRAA
jgi:hypothetical protein